MVHGNPDIEYFILDFNPDHHPLGNLMLAKCVVSLYRCVSPTIDFRVTMINQGGNDKHHDLHHKFRSRFNYRLVDLPSNVGVSRAINMAASMCRAPLMCLVTSDCMFTKGLDLECIKVLREHDDVSICTPLSNCSDLTYQRAQVPERFGSPQVTLPPASEQLLDCISCELTITFYDCRIFQTIGCYDERWKAGHENNDYNLRAAMVGQRSVIVQTAYAWHYGHGTMQTGASKKAYSGYMDGAVACGGSYEAIALWRHKWPGLNINLQGSHSAEVYEQLASQFEGNICLPFIQLTGY